MIKRDRLVKTFCDLVQIDSPSGEEEAIAQELVRRLEALGFTVRQDHHGNVIATEGGEEPLMLSAHMDTVEPGRGIEGKCEFHVVGLLTGNPGGEEDPPGSVVQDLDVDLVVAALN
mgnify:CR=1 FL=1